MTLRRFGGNKPKAARHSLSDCQGAARHFEGPARSRHALHQRHERFPRWCSRRRSSSVADEASPHTDPPSPAPVLRLATTTNQIRPTRPQNWHRMALGTLKADRGDTRMSPLRGTRCCTPAGYTRVSSSATCPAHDLAPLERTAHNSGTSLLLQDRPCVVFNSPWALPPDDRGRQRARWLLGRYYLKTPAACSS